MIACYLNTFAFANAASKRVALVIGNSTYEHTSVLNNPKNDAVAISAALKAVGFEVITAIDAKYRDMPKVLSQFDQKLRTAEVGLLYYSGHGLQIEGSNYLVPIDADISSEIDVQFQTVRLDRILNVMQSGPKTTLVFLDACRDNPLAKKLSRSLKTRSSIIGRGLARIKAQSDMMVAYATAPGDIAQDGSGKYSPFTKAMVAHIATPGLDISQMLRRVRKDVMSETGHEQVPWTNSSLTSDFIFKAKRESGAAIATRAGPQQAGSNSRSFEQNAWNATVKVGTCGAYQHFKKSYSRSFYAGLASSWINENCAKTAQPAKPKRPDVVAMLPATPQPPADRVKNLPDPKILARALQSELQRVGCLSGRVDGVWGRGSRRGVDEYNRVASRKISPDSPSLEAINVLKSASKSTCQLQPDIARVLPGTWSCNFRTDVYLTRAVFLMKKGKRVIGEKCAGNTVISEFDGKYYWLKQTQDCSTKSVLNFGVPVNESSTIKSKLWFKGDVLYGQAYQTSKKNVPAGWNPVARFKLSDTVLKTSVDGYVTQKGEKYRFATSGTCVR